MSTTTIIEVWNPSYLDYRHIKQKPKHRKKKR